MAALEGSMRELADEELLALTDTFRARLDDEPLDTLLPKVFAAGREAGIRTLGQRAMDEQIAAAAALCRGRLVEMKTGEGKTLAIALAAYAWSLPGEGVHVITANDYLAERDATWMRPLYAALDVSCGQLPAEDTRARILAYRADVTYLAPTRAANDYLANNMVTTPGERPQRPLRRAIVDEADLVLIDQGEYRAHARQRAEAAEFNLRYRNMARLVARLDPKVHCVVDAHRHLVTLTDEGVALLEDEFGIADLYQGTEPELQRALDDTLRARFGYERDRDYVLLDGGVTALNQATGRVDGSAGLPDGLTQAIEIKEGLEPSPLHRILGTISFRGVLRRYPHLAAATGTAVEERLYREAYDLEIERIPTHRPVLRIDRAPLFYATGAQRARAALEQIAERRASGRPVLVVTASIAQCTEFSAVLHGRGIPHEVLTANNHRQEAEIIARAGQVGAVTVVTRMAGRGVDIRLGGDDPAEHLALVRAGGLYVLGFDLFENRRLELHMRGRAGRRGDPGESAILLSLEDATTAAKFSDTARRRLALLTKNEPLDSKVIVARAMLGQLDKATQRLETYLLKSFRLDEIRDLQAAEVYRRRDELIDERGTGAEQALQAVDELWCEHLVALQDVAAETTLHGLSGSAWEARYRQEANRLFQALLKRIAIATASAAAA